MTDPMKRHLTLLLLLLALAPAVAAAQEDHTTLNTSLAATNITSGKNIAAYFINVNGKDFIEAKAVGSKGGTRLVRLAAKAPFTKSYSVTAVLADGTVAPIKLRYANTAGLPDYNIESSNFKPARIVPRDGRHPVTVSVNQDLFLTFPADVQSVVNGAGDDIRWRIVQGKGLRKGNILALHALNPFPQSRTVQVHLKNGRKYTLEVFYSYYKDELDILSGEIR